MYFSIDNELMKILYLKEIGREMTATENPRILNRVRPAVETLQVKSNSDDEEWAAKFGKCIVKSVEAISRKLGRL